MNKYFIGVLLALSTPLLAITSAGQTAIDNAGQWNDTPVVTAIVNTAPVPTLYAPVNNECDLIISGKLTLPVIVDKTSTGTNKGKEKVNQADDSLLGDVPTSDTTGKDDKSTTEECYLAMIRIKNQPVHVFAVGFGADELPDFSILANPNGTQNTGGNGYTGNTGTTLNNGFNSNSQYGNMGNPYSTPYGNQYGNTQSPAQPIVATPTSSTR